MKNVGLTAALLIVALLMIGTVNALSINETPQKVITIRGISPGTLMTSDGQVIHVTYHEITNASAIGSVIGSSLNETHENSVKIESAGPGLTRIGSQIALTQFSKIPSGSKSLATNGVSGSLQPGYATYWGPFSWSAGTLISATATWTPSNQDIYLGIYDDASGQGEANLISGGSGTYAVDVPWSSNDWCWYIYSPNWNTATIYYTLN